MKSKHRKALSHSLPHTHRKIELKKIIQEVRETNKKFNKNMQIIQDICLPLQKENQNFHDDMKKVHYVKSNQYNNETNILFKKIERQYKEKGYKIPSLSFGEDTVFKQSPLLLDQVSFNKYYQNHPPPQTEGNKVDFSQDKHYNYILKMRDIVRCRENRVNEDDIDEVRSLYCNGNVEAKSKVDYPVENEKLRINIEELTAQTSKLSIPFSLFKKPTKHTSSNFIKISTKSKIQHLKTFFNLKPQNIQSEITNFEGRVLTRKKTSKYIQGNLSTFFPSHNKSTKPSTEVSFLQSEKPKKVFDFSRNKEENLNKLYSETKDLNNVLSNEFYMAELKKYFDQYNNEKYKNELNKKFSMKSKNPFSMYKSHCLDKKIINSNIYSKLKEFFMNINRKNLNISKYKISLSKMKKADKKLNKLDEMYTKTFASWYSF